MKKNLRKALLVTLCIGFIGVLAACGGEGHVHEWELTEEIAATCEEKGLKTFACSCGENYSVVVSELRHDFKTYQSNNDATCGKDGTKTSVCEREGCDEKWTLQDVGSALKHNYGEYVSNNDAKCGVDGTKTAVCLNGCGNDITITDKGSALEHLFSEYVFNNDAKCEQEGTKTAVCAHGCGAEDVQTEVGSALVHKWVDKCVRDMSSQSQ